LEHIFCSETKCEFLYFRILHEHIENVSSHFKIQNSYLWKRIISKQEKINNRLHHPTWVLNKHGEQIEIVIGVWCLCVGIAGFDVEEGRHWRAFYAN
jgi:hypothetical protein